MQFQGTTTPSFNQINPGVPVRIPQQPIRATSPMGIPVNRTGIVGPVPVSPGGIPTNLNYPINQSRIPVNNNNFIPSPSQIIGQGKPQFMPRGTPQFLPMQYVGQPLGPHPLPQGNYIGHNLGMPMGTPYNIVPARPTYIGYRKLDDSSLINSSIKKQKIDTTIHEQPIFCVICQTEYLAKDKQTHIQKHQRKAPSTEVIKKLKQYKDQYTGLQTRPIVQPEQYNIQYNPNSFVVEQQTNFLTHHVQPIPQIPKHQFGVGTSDNVSMGNSLNTPSSTVFKPQSVSLTENAEQVTYVDKSQFQGGRVIRESTINPPPPNIANNNINESRFTRNTFISDQPAPIVQPNSGIYGRETIQSQQFNGSQAFTSQRVGGQQVSFTSSTPTPIPVSNTLPARDTVVSQDYRTSSTPQFNSLQVTEKITNNHQSVMSPIHQQSQNRQTISQTNHELLHPEPEQQSVSRAGSSQYNTNTQYQQNQPRSTINPTTSSVAGYQLDNSGYQIGGSGSSQRIPQNNILDTFGNTNTIVNGVIPRQSRKVIQFDPNTNNITNVNSSNVAPSLPDIPIEAIILDKITY